MPDRQVPRESLVPRSGHESLDVDSRMVKARKIATILGDRLFGADVLDIGVGAGIITSALGRRVGPRGSVQGVDVRDSRLERDGYEFRLVEDVALPFDDSSFDVVVSNHVIEHVGESSAQLRHLEEIARVLRKTGTAYLATPNRWTLVEPHFRLPFLSWLPPPLADRYVRLARRGSEYDCTILTRSALRRLMANAGFRFTEKTVEAIALSASLERNRLARAIASLPSFMQRALRLVAPTTIWLLYPE